MDNFLKKYVEHCEIFYKQSFMILMDKHLTAVFVGDKFLEVAERTRESIIGVHIHGTAKIPSVNLEPSLKAFNKAISQNKIINLIITNLNRRNVDLHTLGAQLYPVQNPNTQEVVGLRFEFNQIKLDYFFHIVIKVLDKIEVSPQPDNDTFLTSREHQIAFLLFYCKNTTEIAQVITLFNNKTTTEKTIRNIISKQLYPKFAATNRASLMNGLKEAKYDQKIPNSLLSNQFIDLSD